jgi:hypothetical protein
MESTIYDIPGKHSHYMTFVHNEIYGKKFVVKHNLVFNTLLKKRMQHGMTRAVCGGTGSLYSIFAKFLRMPTKFPLENFSIFYPAKGHTHVFKLDNNFRSHTAHEFYSVLITKVVTSFYGVEHVPEPVIRLHVAERCGDTPLSRNGV